MTASQIRNMRLSGSKRGLQLILREIAAQIAEFNERALKAEPLALELAKLSLEGLKKLQVEIAKDPLQ